MFIGVLFGKLQMERFDENVYVSRIYTSWNSLRSESVCRKEDCILFRKIVIW